MTGARIRVVVYARVSTEDQAERGYSLEAQIEDCLRRATELGYEQRNVLVLSDDVSGTLLERPGLNRLRELVAEEVDQPELVIVYDPDRLARKLSLQLLLTDELTRRGVRLEFVNFEWNNTPEGRMFYQLRGMFAEFEREKIRERTIRGRITKLKTSGKLSLDPRLYGYRFDTERDVLVIDPAEAGVIRYMFRAAAAGASGEEIARQLASDGVPAPRGAIWYGSTVTRILRNESYLGTYWAYKVDYHQGYRRQRPRSEQFPLQIEPTVEPELFEQAQAELDRKRSSAGRTPQRQLLLSGLAVCACGRPMVAGAAAGGRQYAYYVCGTRHKQSVKGEPHAKRCATGYWNTEAVDEAVWRHVCSFISENAPSAAATVMLSRLSGNETAMEPERELLQSRLAENERRLLRLLDLYLSGGIARQLYEESQKKLEREGERLTLRLKELMEKEHTEPYWGTLPSEWQAADWEMRLISAHYETRRQMVKLLVEKVEFNEARLLKLHFRVPFFSQNAFHGESDGGL